VPPWGWHLNTTVILTKRTNFKEGLVKQLLFISLFLLIATRWAFATDLASDLIGSKTYWQTMDWGEADESELWTISGWEPYAGSQDPEKTIVKERLVYIDGKSLTAQFQIEETPKRHNTLVVFTTGLPHEECQQVVEWLVRQFGQPNRVVDRSYSADLVAKGNTVKTIDTQSQWEIGTTRITSGCWGIKTASQDVAKPQASLAVLIFGSKAHEREIKPLIGLRCTQQMKFVGIDLPPQTRDDLFFVIDENGKGSVRHPNKRPVPGEHQVTEEAITVTAQKGGQKYEFSIDRFTGAFHGQLRHSDGRGLGIDLTGQCEKIDISNRKF